MTVKKNQSHGSRSRRQPHGKFQPPREGEVGTDPFTDHFGTDWAAETARCGHWMEENRMKPSVNTGEVSLPAAQSAGWGRKIGGQEANDTENSQFETAKRLATPSDGRIIAKTTRKTQFAP